MAQPTSRVPWSWWDICWRSKRALVLMGTGLLLQMLLYALLWLG